MPGGRYPWASRTRSRGESLLGGGFPILFRWKAETASAPPGLSTLSRSTAAEERTTDDGGTSFWFQTLLQNETHFKDLRRVQNHWPAFDNTTWTAFGTSSITGTTATIDAGFNNRIAPNSGAFWNDTTSPVLFAVELPPSSDWSDDTAALTLEIADNVGSTTTIATAKSGTTVWQVVRLAPLTSGSHNIRVTSNKTVTIPNIKIWAFRVKDTSSVFPGRVEFATTYNANVSAVRWFNTEVANTVDGFGEVTEIAGAVFNGGRYLPEPVATQLVPVAAIRDFTDASWIATNITPVQDAIGIDGAQQASTLTSTAANGTILLSLTRASAEHTFSVFVARKTGTGTIEITINGGSTWVDITSSLSADITQRFRITLTLANPSIGFRIVTSGDEIEVDFANLVEDAVVTSPVNAASRGADNFNSGIASPLTGYTVFVDATGPEDGAGGGNVSAAIGHASFFAPIVMNASGEIAKFYGGTATISGSDWRDVRKKVSCSLANDAVGTDILSATGETTVTQSSTLSNASNVLIGDRASVDQFRGGIHEAIIYGVALDQAQNEGLVA